MIKVILADTQAIFRTGAAKVLDVEDDLRIVAQAQSEEQLMIAIVRFRGAVLLIATNFHQDLKNVFEVSTAVKTCVVLIRKHNDSPQRFLSTRVFRTVF